MASKVDWRYRMARWMAGRYGADDFSRGLFVLSVILVVINLLLHSSLLSLVALFALLLGLVRMFSRNAPARMKENQVYNGLMVKPRAWWARMNAQADARRARAQAAERAGTSSAKASKDRTSKSQRRPRRATSQTASQTTAHTASQTASRAADQTAAADRPKAGLEYMFFVCEECGQRLTVPKGKGKLRVTCPKCGHVTMRES